jgi:hypothetical protein
MKKCRVSSDQRRKREFHRQDAEDAKDEVGEMSLIVLGSQERGRGRGLWVIGLKVSQKSQD